MPPGQSRAGAGNGLTATDEGRQFTFNDDFAIDENSEEDMKVNGSHVQLGTVIPGANS